MNVLKKVSEMLQAEEVHKRIAAAVVLGELRVKDPEVVSALLKLARDPLDAYASAALEALGQIGSVKAIPVFLEALGRGGDVKKSAMSALSHLGGEAVPFIKARLEDAPPEVRAALSQLLPSLGGKGSFQLVLDGLVGQPFDAANRIALSVRQEVKGQGPAERRSLRTQVERFLEKKRVKEDEVALRCALKILGFLELPEAADTLLPHLSARQPTLVRVEATTALRFSLGRESPRKPLRRLFELLEDPDSLVARAARDTLTVLKLGPDDVEDLERMAKSESVELALWAMNRLATSGGKRAEKTLQGFACGADRMRAQVAAKYLSELPEGQRALLECLLEAREEVGAQVLSEALLPHARSLTRQEVARLGKVGAQRLAKSVSIGTRVLEPLRQVDPTAWAEVLRNAAKASLKKDLPRALGILAMLCRSSHANADDRFSFARLLLASSPCDLHPRARDKDPALVELERLAEESFPLARALDKDRWVSDAARYYVGFHLAERQTPGAHAAGIALLSSLAERLKKKKLGKAAKNKLSLLGAL